jgi:hypothetical protein
MSKDAITNAANMTNSKQLSPITNQYTTHTTLNGELSSTQIDREQDIKTFGICVGAGVALAGIFMLCKAFGNND